MHPLMVLIHPLLVLIRGIEGGALASTTGAKAWIGGAHRVEYSLEAQSFRQMSPERDVRRPSAVDAPAAQIGHGICDRAVLPSLQRTHPVRCERIFWPAHVILLIYTNSLV